MTAKKPNDELPDLSGAEWEVIQALWSLGQGAARDIFAQLQPDCEWSIRTVKTLLARMVAKGAIDYIEIGNSYLYRPVYTQDQLTRKEVSDFVEKVGGGQVAPVLLRLVEASNLSADDLVKLRRLLDEKTREQSGEKL